QGMKGDAGQARRYHWQSEGLVSFVEEAHAAIAGRGQGEIVNLTDRRAGPSRQAQVEILASIGPDRIAREGAALELRAPRAELPVREKQPLLPHLVMPEHHDVQASDVFIRRLHGTL